MIEASGERYIEARSEQIWIFVDNANCLTRWLSFATQIEVIDGNGLGRRQRVHGRYHALCDCVDQEVTAYEPARLLEWTHTDEHPSIRRVPRMDRTTVITVRLIPEGGGTRVRIEGQQVAAGPVRGVMMRLLTHRALRRHIRQSLERLDGLLKGRVGD